MLITKAEKTTEAGHWRAEALLDLEKSHGPSARYVPSSINDCYCNFYHILVYEFVDFAVDHWGLFDCDVENVFF